VYIPWFSLFSLTLLADRAALYAKASFTYFSSQVDDGTAGGEKSWRWRPPWVHYFSPSSAHHPG
jgi:hypothetical protein